MEANTSGKGITRVRISKSLSEGEKTATTARKEKVKEALAKLGIHCGLENTPNIAILGAGGAVRAMISLYSTLTELKKYNLLDCAMYLGGVSGSTWCMPALYKNEDWTEKIEILCESQLRKLVQGQWDLNKATKTLIEAAEDECYSLTDFWSYILVHKLLNELDENELSAHGRSCESGRNPYPIYAAVNKETYLNQNAGTWFEFTPHEVGITGLGAYVDTRYFGSVFQSGQLIEERKAKNICYLQGLWGSALGGEQDISKTIADALWGILKYERSEEPLSIDLDKDDEKFSVLYQCYQTILELHLLDPLGERPTQKIDHLKNILKDYSFSNSYELVREIYETWQSADKQKKQKNYMRLFQALDSDFGGSISELNRIYYNILKKTSLCLLNWTWGSTNNFLYNSSNVEFPEITSNPTISLIDAGLAINTAYPPILRPERQVKLILSFDFSAGDPFLTIKNTAEYCKTHGIPFPEIDETELQDLDNPSDCYIFRGENTPIVLHCPLFNTVNCPDQIAEYRELYPSFKMSYSGEEIEKLVTAAKKNVANVHQKILDEIKHIVGSSSK